jgi:hypothetical protein
MEDFTLRPFVEDKLWTAEMPFHPPGFDVGARMTVVRLSGGGLFVHSPIELKPELKRQIDGLGAVSHIVCPFRMHTAHLREFAEAYPGAKLYAPPDLPPKKTTEGLTFAAVLGEAPEPDWAGELDQALFKGNKLDNEVVFFHPSTRTLILTDLCFNVPSSRGFGTSLVAGLLGVRDKMGTSRTIKLMTKDREASRASIRRMLGWDFDRVILSHGDNVETGGKAAFREAFRWLLD